MIGHPTLLALVVAFSGVVNARAICVQSPPPCESLKQSSHVFLADVARTSGGEVTFRVLETFKGLSRYQREFQAGLEGLNEENIRFITQHRYLVYGTQEPDGFHTTCTRTREVLPEESPRRWLASELWELRQCH